MAIDFDSFPTYDPLVRSNSNYMSEVWVAFMSNFVQNLSGYLSQNGIFLPTMTESQRDSIKSPINGQMIFVSDLSPNPKAQVYENGSWANLV